MTIVSIEVKKNAGENNAGLLRRFSRKMQESGTIPKVKGGRYAARKPSKLVLKKKTLKKLVRRKEIERLKKMGKMA